MSNLSELLPSGGGQNQVEFVASGTLPNGKPVVLKADGTVEVVGETTVAEDIPSSSEYVFHTALTNDVSTAFDPNTANKFVVAYGGNSEATGKAVVGTVSGTSISFGTEVQFNSGYTTFPSISFDPNTANKFIIAFSDGGNSYHGKVVVGTVSGTSLSFGSEIVFNSATTLQVTASFDPNTANKFVVAYRDAGNSSYGTARVGTVSGTSISYGSEIVYNSASSNNNSIAFDPNTAGKFVVSYLDSNGAAIVGTVSGTSISFGSEVVFNSANTELTVVAFDPSNAGKLAITYADYGNSQYGTVIVGTVSGNSISFGTEIVYNAGAVARQSISFDSKVSGKFVIAYKDGGNNSYGTSILGSIAITSTNLTSTNLIGIAAEAASSGATAKINTWGGINEAQSSLTIASDYYVQDDGTITTATGGQKVGQAISATTINMRNQP